MPCKQSTPEFDPQHHNGSLTLPQGKHLTQSDVTPRTSNQLKEKVHVILALLVYGIELKVYSKSNVKLLSFFKWVRDHCYLSF